MGPLDIFAWIVFLTMVACGVGLFVFLGNWPGKVAVQREHPYRDAIKIGSWIGLLAGGVIWPVILIWAYSTPVVDTPVGEQ